MIQLPEPQHDGQMSVEAAIVQRVSTRKFADEPLTLEHLSQLLWAAQGSTKKKTRRTVPSAGAIYPLVTYAVVRDVDGLEPGIYQYHPHQHSLELARKGDFHDELSSAAFNQGSIQEVAVNIVLTARHRRMTSRYGSRARRYIDMEIGHAGQNIYMQATALGLGTVAIGAFEDIKVQRILSITDDEEPLYIMPVGWLASEAGG